MTPEDIAAQIVRSWWKTQDQLIPTAHVQTPLIDAIAAALRAYGAACAQAERTACLTALDGLYHGDACRAILRSRAANAEEPGAVPGG